MMKIFSNVRIRMIFVGASCALLTCLNQPGVALATPTVNGLPSNTIPTLNKMPVEQHASLNWTSLTQDQIPPDIKTVPDNEFPELWGGVVFEQDENGIQTSCTVSRTESCGEVTIVGIGTATAFSYKLSGSK